MEYDVSYYGGVKVIRMKVRLSKAPASKKEVRALCNTSDVRGFDVKEFDVDKDRWATDTDMGCYQCPWLSVYNITVYLERKYTNKP